VKFARKILLLLSLLLFQFFVIGQESNLRRKTLYPSASPQLLDTFTVYPTTVKVFVNGIQFSKENYEINSTTGTISFLQIPKDSVCVEFRVLPMNLSKTYKVRDTSQIFTIQKGEYEKFLQTQKQTYDEVFGSSGLKKSGSISRGLSFGNNQNVSLNSTLNLELSGDISPNLKILASVTDKNIPMQPEGNTSKLQEFDQVFIQIYNDKFKLIAGDFWINKPPGYFLTYKKRGQGISTEYEWNTLKGGNWKSSAAVGLSKGKYARQIIPGIEGNQGPYKLKGNENEPFIIVLSGTEKVYIDGRLLNRGQENDYMINYNTAEVTFTSRNSITKDARIVVEFQYSDQNYARSLATANLSYSKDNFSFWLNTYSEQDAKNQTLQQSLSDQQKLLIASVGDSLQLAHTFSVDSIGFLENQNMYRKIDTLGFTNVLVYSIDPKQAYNQCTFTYVGANRGNYVFEKFNALGKIFHWVAPINGQPQGDYEPIRLLITPKQKQFVSTGASYKLSKTNTIETEFASSKNNQNTFSQLDKSNDVGFSNRTRFTNEMKLGKDSIAQWKLKSKAEIEYLSANFTNIEVYRSAEFDRDWNTRNKGFVGQQLSTSLGTNLEHSKKGTIGLEATRYEIGSNYLGNKAVFAGKWKSRGFSADWTSSYLDSKTATLQNSYLRHKAVISQQIGKIKLGYKDDQEENRFSASSLLNPSSYSFYDYQFFLANADSSHINYKVFYRERYDKRSDSSRLTPVAKARTFGSELSVLSQKNQRLNFILNYRELTISNSKLMNQAPENTLLGRVDYDLNFWKGALTWNSFYEIGSGLELKKEFLYIKVNDGQGVYTWIDYNLDGIKDLNEFEVSQYVDQASYIRVFTPSNNYTKTFSNELNQGLFLKPERIWSSSEGIKKVASYFSNQIRMRINRKTNQFDAKTSLNPFASSINDVNLISTNYNLRNTLYFNRTSSIFGAEYIFQDNQTKTLLATGFDARNQRYHELNIRWNVLKVILIESNYQIGTKEVNADYTTGRNFYLNYQQIKPSISYQPSTITRFTIDSRFSTKLVKTGESATVKEITFRIKYNQAEKGSLQSSFSMLQINFQGNASSAVGFELLEALKPGNNATWNVGYQRNVSKKLQISIQYTGRKSESSRMIHTGGMEVRAYF
jgi:hypothetical protein